MTEVLEDTLQNLNCKDRIPCTRLSSKPIIDEILKNIIADSNSNGKIFVYDDDVAEAYEIGSKETGDVAL